MGLDNAGKTSIVLSLRGDRNLLSYCQLSPTKDHEIINMQFQDTQFNIWDFGGQRTYRDKHLDNFQKYFKGCNKLIYVIDIQDTDRWDKAIKYLEEVTNRIENHKDSMSFSIFLHKYDPKLKKIRPDISDEMIEELIEKIKVILESKMDYRVFKTTIYTNFEKIPINF